MKAKAMGEIGEHEENQRFRGLEAVKKLAWVPIQ
jgi:hypothetical protein